MNLFRCEKLSCSLTVKACAKRHLRAAREHGTARRDAFPSACDMRVGTPCHACPIGETNARSVGEAK